MMKKKYRIGAEQEAELIEARRRNKNKGAEKRLKALIMRAQGKKNAEVAQATDYHPAYVSQLVSTYCNEGLSAVIENHYAGNRRNMSLEEEEAIFGQYREEAEKGQLVSINELKRVYEEAVGHPISGGQIYRVLKRHEWRKVMPRSQHPNKASEEEIASSKKLTER